MKILIVDDNKNNRMILRLLLEDYTEDNNLKDFDIAEAEDGQIAVDMFKQSSYDIVFMDIMMPNMDGIEATKHIRAMDSKTMIIAVSAVDDGERKKLILNSGAEDYIAKPVNSDIFVNRLANYIVLSEARNHKKVSKHHLNLFTSEVYSRYLNFMINSEDAISEFWEYYLLTDDAKHDDLSDVVRTIFAIADTQVRLSIESDIVVEYSEDKSFFTLTNVDQLPPKIVELLIKKNNLLQEYKIADGSLCIALENVEPEEIEVIAPVIPVVPVAAVAMAAPIVEEVAASPVSFAASKELEVFD